MSRASTRNCGEYVLLRQHLQTQRMAHKVDTMTLLKGSQRIDEGRSRFGWLISRWRHELRQASWADDRPTPGMDSANYTQSTMKLDYSSFHNIRNIAHNTQVSFIIHRCFTYFGEILGWNPFQWQKWTLKDWHSLSLSLKATELWSEIRRLPFVESNEVPEKYHRMHFVKRIEPGICWGEWRGPGEHGRERNQRGLWGWAKGSHEYITFS